MWDGSAFNCPLNEILLRHSQFPAGNVRGICNAGDICGHADNRGENDTFISRLIANVTSDLVNKTIACSYDDGSIEHLVNSSVVSLTKGDIIDVTFIVMLTVRTIYKHYGENIHLILQPRFLHRWM